MLASVYRALKEKNERKGNQGNDSEKWLLVLCLHYPLCLLVTVLFLVSLHALLLCINSLNTVKLPGFLLCNNHTLNYYFKLLIFYLLFYQCNVLGDIAVSSGWLSIPTLKVTSIMLHMSNSQLRTQKFSSLWILKVVCMTSFVLPPCFSEFIN